MAMISTKVLMGLLAQCATDVPPQTLQTIMAVESNFNPYAIAVIYPQGVSESQKLKFNPPQSEEEAQRIIKQLNTPPIKYKSYSVGLMQINSSNFQRFGITSKNMFDSCKNIAVGAEIFKECYAMAKANNPKLDPQDLLRKASSCYYSGNEIRGFKAEKNGVSYVERINAKVAKNYAVPEFKPLDNPSPNQTKTVRPWDIFEDF